ncbi:MAG: TetR/AcrR family transcriptional regulator [Syntrophomonas sp.]
MKDTAGKSGKRQIILEAAVKVFSSKGYHNTRMEEIAVAAGIGKGTIYEYFSSKLELFKAMLESSLQYYFEALGQETFKLMSLQERIRILIETHCRFSLEKKDLTKIIFCDHNMLDDDLLEWAMNMRCEKQRRTMEFIEEGIIKEEFREDIDKSLMGLVLSSTLAGLGAVISLNDWNVDPALVAVQLSDVIMNGIKKN